MEFTWWLLAVPVVIAAMLVWGFRAARRTTLAVTAAALLLVSGWLLWTLVLEEPFVDTDASLVALIGTPALLGAVLALRAIKFPSTRAA